MFTSSGFQTPRKWLGLLSWTGCGVTAVSCTFTALVITGYRSVRYLSHVFEYSLVRLKGLSSASTATRTRGDTRSADLTQLVVFIYE